MQTTTIMETKDYQFTDYGRDGGEIIVAGGGLGNGNAYAVVYKEGPDYIYHEVGKNEFLDVHYNSTLEWNEKHTMFNIVKRWDKIVTRQKLEE